jgi:hypothetical protein
MNKVTKKSKKEWLKWVKTYGIGNFFDAFIKNVEGAESTCRYCGNLIYVDITIGGGVPDWSTEGGDFGCDASPETTPEGCGGHSPCLHKDLS